MAPMNLREICPRLQTVVPPKGKAMSRWPATFQAAPSSHTRTDSISTNDPPRAYFIPAGHDAFSVESCDWRIPNKGDAAIQSSLHHSLLQSFPPHSNAMSARKFGAYGSRAILKSNAPKHEAILFAQYDSEFEKRCNRIRKKSFSTCFCNGRLRAIGNSHSKAALACRDCSCQPCWTPSYHENVRVHAHLSRQSTYELRHKSESLQA